MTTGKKLRTDEYCNEECVLTPAVDIYETKEEYRLKLEMPGVSKDDLSVTMDNNELVIEGKVHESVPENSKLKYAEYSLYNYHRKFRVGNDIDRNKIDATLENGILTLVLHKSEEAKPKKIEVKVA